METKTAKILSVQENQRSYDYQGTKYYVHQIKFEGSEFTWNYDSKSITCEKFKVGETQTFDTDIKVNGTFTNYKIKPAQTQGGYSGGGGNKPKPKDEGIITYLSCFSSSCNYYCDNKIASEDDVFKMAERAFTLAMSKSTLK